MAAGDTSDAAAAAAAAAVLQVNDRRRQMQSQLILIMHAHKCNQLSQANGLSSQPQLCHVPECAQLRTTLKHMTECEDKKTCKGYYAGRISPFFSKRLRGFFWQY